MKKLLTVAIACGAMLLAACGGKSATSDPDAVNATAQGAAEKVVALLQEQLANADADQIKAIGTQVAEQVAEFIAQGDTEAAQTYAGIISSFIDNNAEQLQAIGASSTLTEALAAVAALPQGTADAAQASAESAADIAASQAEAAKEAAAETVQNAEQAVRDAAAAQVDAAKAAAAEQAAAAQAAADAQVDAARQGASQSIDNAAAAAKKKLGL